MSTRTIQEFTKRQQSNVYGKPPRSPRCTVQIIDTTEKPRHVCKLTVYADPLNVENVIRTALYNAWRRS